MTTNECTNCERLRSAHTDLLDALELLTNTVELILETGNATARAMLPECVQRAQAALMAANPEYSDVL
jgi:hypothetical protein